MRFLSQLIGYVRNAVARTPKVTQVAPTAPVVQVRRTHTARAQRPVQAYSPKRAARRALGPMSGRQYVKARKALQREACLAA